MNPLYISQNWINTDSTRQYKQTHFPGFCILGLIFHLFYQGKYTIYYMSYLNLIFYKIISIAPFQSGLNTLNKE